MGSGLLWLNSGGVSGKKRRNDHDRVRELGRESGLHGRRNPAETLGKGEEALKSGGGLAVKDSQKGTRCEGER